MLNSLNFNHLYYFHIIAKEGSLAKATTVLNVSQPTLSQQLRNFEEKIGRELFGRKGRSLELNQDGKYIFEHTSKIFAEAENMISGFTYNQKMGTRAQYKVGITPSASKTYATTLLKPLFMDETLGIKIIEGDIERLLSNLYSFELDFILTENISTSLINKNVEQTLITTPKYFFVCGRKFKKEIKRIPEDLNECPYFKYSINNELQKEVDRYFFKNNTLPSVVGESDDVNIIASATEINHCFSILPDSVIKSGVDEERLRVLGEFPSTDAHVSALHLKSVSKADVQNVIKTIKEQY